MTRQVLTEVNGYEIGVLQPEDYRAVHALRHQPQIAFQCNMELMSRYTSEAVREWTELRSGDNENFMSLAAMHEGLVVSVGSLQWKGPETVLGLFIDERHTGKGLGSAFFNLWFAEAVARGIPQLNLWVYDDNPARKLYERLGFGFTGENAIQSQRNLTYRTATPEELVDQEWVEALDGVTEMIVPVTLHHMLKVMPQEP
jgi:GNAT superfamily N-acetyltransferase